MRGNAREHTLDRPATKQPHSSNLIPPAKRFLQFSLSLFSSIFFFYRFFEAIFRFSSFPFVLSISTGSCAIGSITRSVRMRQRYFVTRIIPKLVERQFPFARTELANRVDETHRSAGEDQSRASDNLSRFSTHRQMVRCDLVAEIKSFLGETTTFRQGYRFLRRF